MIGGYREHYRSTGNGQGVVINGKSMPYLQGRPVDAADVMPDGREFSNVEEFKQLLLTDIDMFARALTIRLLTYGTGGLIEASDQREVSDILER